MDYWDEPSETGGFLNRPGIYRFTIADHWIYVGKFSRGSRPRLEYKRNVKRLSENLPYRKSDPEGFRVIHRALWWAVRTNKSIRIEIVENVEFGRLNERERYWISQTPSERSLNNRSEWVDPD